MAEQDYSSRLCAVCGSELIQATYNQKTCSSECRLIHYRKTSREYQRSKRVNLPPAPARLPSRCEECSSLYISRSASRKTCSAKCQKARKARTRPSRSVLAQALAKEIRRCGYCSLSFIPNTYQQQYCNGRCKQSAAVRASTAKYVGKRKKHQERACAVCGTGFAPRDARQLTCSLLCSHKLYSRIGAHTRRARMAGVHSEQVDPFKVFDRDKWRCQLCGCKTPRAKRGTHDGNAPELDHIIPIAKGGAHSYLNTQCACRKCNMKKADKPLGQMLLIGDA